MSKVSIIILNYNGRSKLGPLLDEAIESAINQSYGDVEVLFVDNGSSDDSVKYVRERFGDFVRVVELGHNYGFCLGNNLAIRYVSADSKYILFQNPDAVLSKDYVETLVNLMNGESKIGAAQGLQLSMDGFSGYCGGFVDSYGRGVEVVVSNRLVKHLRGVFRVYWVSGSAMLIRRRLFELLGGFPGEFFMYHDEIDLCSRIRAVGYECICYPATSYRHARGGIVGGGINWITWYFANRNRWLTSLRYLPLNYLIESILMSGATDLIANFIKSFKPWERNRLPLLLRIYLYLARNIRRELSKRIMYTRTEAFKGLRDYIIRVPNPLVKEPLLEYMALIKAFETHEKFIK